MKTNIEFNNPDSTIKLTLEQAAQLGINTDQDEQQGILKTFGVWNIPVNYKALAMSAVYDRETILSPTVKQKTFYGQRTLTNVRQDGYYLEGYVSINGKKYSAFTSDQLFEVNGKLINVATIHARVK